MQDYQGEIMTSDATALRPFSCPHVSARLYLLSLQVA
jgi:hypothetical protein